MIHTERANPWFFRGKAGIGGIGGPHIGYGYIWPMSLTMRALTSGAFHACNCVCARACVCLSNVPVVTCVVCVIGDLLDDDEEITMCLEHLKRSSAGTGFLHESFHMDDVHDFTRPWFAWANTLFGELILDLSRRKPHLLF